LPVRRLLVTGRHGFVGNILAGMLDSEPQMADWALAPLSPDFQILDAEATRHVVADAAPDAVIHLAAQSFVPESFRDPEGTLRVNLFGTLNLLKALRDARFEGPMLFVSSGDVYGLVPEAELPISESRLPAPRNPYAVSKLAAEALCCQWAATEGMRIVVARAFNHIGPGQSDRFAIAGFAHQLADIRRGKQEPVIVAGDLDVTRDFTDVRDVVAAYFALLEKGVSGERYNVCSGIERSVRSMLDRLIEIAGVEVEIRMDRARLRAAEQRRTVGDPNKIHATTGWQATTPIGDSLAAMLNAA
jgi:GDP-4-dehydro-6-deoxy-D-mannose reductase